MSSTIMEARAIITGEDRTGPAFAAIEAHIKALSTALTSAGIASKNINKISDAVRRASSQMGPPINRIERTVSAMTRGALSTGGALMPTVPLVKKMSQQGGDFMHERIRALGSGMTADEITKMEAESLHLSGKYKVFSQGDIMHAMRNARAVTGSFEEASGIIEPWLKLRMVANAANPHAKPEELEGEFDSLLKGMEQLGVTMDSKKFTDYINGIAQGLNAFGDTLKPSQIFESIQYGRQASAMLSREFILGIAPALTQEMRGQSFGNAVSGFNRAIVGGTLSHTGIQQMVDLGLVDMTKDAKGNYKYLEKTKTGSIKGIKSGGVKDWQIAQSDPFAWTHDVLLPAMVKKGISDPQAQSAILSKMFPRVVAQLMSIMLTQSEKVEKNRAMVHEALDTSFADKLLKGDMATAFQGVQKQLDQLASSASKPFLQPVTDALDVLSSGLAAAVKIADKDKAAAVAGTAATLGAGGVLGATATKLALAAWQGRALLPIFAGAGTTMGLGAAVIGGAYGLYNAERTTADARAHVKESPGYTPSSDDEISALRSELAKIEGELSSARLTQSIGKSSGYSGFDIGMLEAQADTLTQRIARGEAARAKISDGSNEHSPASQFSEALNGKIEAAVKPDQITAELKGEANVNVAIHVEPGSELLKVVQGARSVVSSGNIRANVGGSMPEASAAGRTGGGGD